LPTGLVECRNDGRHQKAILLVCLMSPIIPLLHYSITPIGLSDCFHLFKMFDLLL
jgi:hypothetical protein